MGFMDFLTGGPPIKRHGRRMTDRDSQAEDREASAYWLAKEGSDEALDALCNRFSMQLEHGMKDRKEKDLVFDLLVEHGARGAAVARRFAGRHLAFAYAVRVVERVEGAPAATSLLLDMLARESVDNELKPEKKHHLLVAVAERADARIVAAAAPFLADFDEGVRNAAMEAIAAQEDPSAAEVLYRVLANPKEESTRVRGRVAEVFASKGWPAPSDAWLDANLPVGFRRDGERLVRAGG
jgi:hypothetical protein